MKTRHLVLLAAVVLALFAIISWNLAENLEGICLAKVAGSIALGLFVGYLLGLFAYVLDNLADKGRIVIKPGAWRFLLDLAGKGFNQDFMLVGLDGMEMLMRYMFLAGSLALAIIAGFTVVLGSKGEEGPLLPFCFSFLVLFCYSFIFIVKGLDAFGRWLQDAEDAFGRFFKAIANRVMGRIV